jgi:hypothetical protein
MIRGLAAAILATCAWGQPTFTPPTGRGCPADVTGGPCGKRLMLARSSDGLNFTHTGRIVADQGDVPDLAIDDAGVLYLYYMSATIGSEYNKMAVAVSRDGGGSWIFYRVLLEGFEDMTEPVDPDVQILPGGAFRLYVTCSRRGERLRTWYAEGTDGIRFARRGVAFEPPGEPLDPNAFFAGGVWHIFAGGMTSQPGANWHGTSSDGVSFTFDGEYTLSKDGQPHAVSNTIAVDGGYRSFAFPHNVPPVINSFFSRDGVEWTAEAGTRLALDVSSGLESDGVKDAAVVRLPGGGFLMVYVTVIAEPAAPAASDLDFRPDPGVRVDRASLPKPGVDDAGAVYLYYEDQSGERSRELRSVSPDGLTVSEGVPPPDRALDPRRLRLPGGKWRLYTYDPQAAELRSSTSSDGLRFTADLGARYAPQPTDRGTFGVYDHFADRDGGVVLLYVGDMAGQNTVRRAYSPPGDDGWTFRFERDNVLGPGGGAASYVDQKAIRLPDGRIRLFTMKQGTVYSFISEDDGRNFRLEPGARLAPDAFPELNLRSLHDPWVVRLADGRYRMYVAGAVQSQPGQPRFAIVSATTPPPQPAGAVKSAFVMAFHACDQAAASCTDPRNHRVYLAESDDGAKWRVVPGWKPYAGSVPDVIRRGNTLYIFSAGQNPLVRYRLDTGVAEPPVPVSLPNLEGGFVDPSLTLDEQGRLVLFFLQGKLGSDPAGCAPGQASCEQHFRSATELEGSDGARFDLDAGDRATVRLGGAGEPRSASDPDIFFDGFRWVLYISHGPSTSVWTATELRGTYRKEADLSEGTGGVASGYFDTASQRYWTYAHTVKNGVAVIRRAIHAGWSRMLGETDWQTVLTGPDFGLSATTNVESPGFAVMREGR